MSLVNGTYLTVQSVPAATEDVLVLLLVEHGGRRSLLLLLLRETHLHVLLLQRRRPATVMHLHLKLLALGSCWMRVNKMAAAVSWGAATGPREAPSTTGRHGHHVRHGHLIRLLLLVLSVETWS